MTAMKDAMTKAGIDTARAELLAKAHEVLSAHGKDATKAVPKFSALLRKRADLLDVLVLDYLRRVAANMPTAKTPSDVSKGAAKGSTAAPPQSSPTASDVSPRDVSVVKHKRARPIPRERTQAEKNAALHVAASESVALRSVFESYKIDGRGLNSIRWGELVSLVHINAMNAAQHLRRGLKETVDALLLAKIKAHVVAADHSAFVPDVIGAETFKQFVAEANAEAPRIIEHGMAKHAEMIEAVGACHTTIPKEITQ